MAQFRVNQRINLIDVEDEIELDIRLPYNRYIVTGELLSPTFDKVFSLIPKGLSSVQKDAMRNAVVEIMWLGIFGTKVTLPVVTILGNVISKTVVGSGGVLYFFYNRDLDTWEYVGTCGCDSGSGSGSGGY